MKKKTKSGAIVTALLFSGIVIAGTSVCINGKRWYCENSCVVSKGGGVSDSGYGYAYSLGTCGQPGQPGMPGCSN